MPSITSGIWRKALNFPLTKISDTLVRSSQTATWILSFPTLYICIENWSKICQSCSLRWTGGSPSPSLNMSALIGRELTGYTQGRADRQGFLPLPVLPGDIPGETSFPRMERRHGVSPAAPWFNSVFRIVTKCGNIKWVREIGRILFSSSGEQLGILAFIFDSSTGSAPALLPFEHQEKGISIPESRSFEGFVGDSRPMLALYDKLSRCASSDAPVLITGESGVGKEVAARAIHSLAHKGTPFVAINCGGINESLMESELFGHAEGAFTGAKGSSRGFIGQADGGVLFLDEVGEIPLSMQIKLLRTLDGYGYIPVGSTRTFHSRFRLVCATNRNTSRLVADGRMREDFFYRIHTLPIHIPPLRAHKEDSLCL